MERRLRKELAVVVLGVTSALVLLLAPSALANTYTVTRTDDPAPVGCHKSNCSLREAVIAANSHAGPDTIMLQGGRTYNLTISPTGSDDASSGDLNLLDTLKITHSGSKRATINAHHIDRVFDFPSTTGGKATLSGLVIEGGSAPMGGGIEVDHGSLKLIDSVVTRNRTTFSDGGGIDTFTTFGVKTSYATIIKSSITGNHAADEGGGIFNGGQRAVILNSTISGNTSVISGGGVANYATMTMRNDTVANNSTQENGGGVSNFHSTTLLNDVTIASNKADSHNAGSAMGGGLFGGNTSILKISNSLIALNTLGTGPGDAGLNCFGTFTSAGNNLRTSNDTGCIGFTSTGDFVNKKPKIGPLSNKGGLTKTIALLTGSPAINKASPKTSEKRDQRGHKRDTKHPDIGAFEAPG